MRTTDFPKTAPKSMAGSRGVWRRHRLATERWDDVTHRVSARRSGRLRGAAERRRRLARLDFFRASLNLTIEISGTAQHFEFDEHRPIPLESCCGCATPLVLTPSPCPNRRAMLAAKVDRRYDHMRTLEARFTETYSGAWYQPHRERNPAAKEARTNEVGLRSAAAQAFPYRWEHRVVLRSG